MRAFVGLDPEVAAQLSVEIGEGLAGEIAERHQIREVEDAARDQRVESAILRRTGVRSLHGVPLLIEQESIGAAHMGSRVAWGFSSEDRGLFGLMAARASAAIQLHRLRDEATSKAQSLSRLEQLISVHPDFFYLLDCQRRFAYMSPALSCFWGKSADDVRGKTHAELGVLDADELRRLELDRVLDGETVRSVTRYRTPDGEERYLENIFAPVFDRSAGHGVRAIAGVTRDVTMQKRGEDELKQALEFRERLIAILGHDLRNPLASIKMGAELLLRGERTPPACVVLPKRSPASERERGRELH